MNTSFNMLLMICLSLIAYVCALDTGAVQAIVSERMTGKEDGDACFAEHEMCVAPK